MTSSELRMEWLLLLIPLLLSLPITLGKTVQVEIFQDRVIHVVRPEFISVTLDMEHLVPPKWGTFNFRLV